MGDDNATCPKPFGGRVSYIHPDLDDEAEKQYIGYRKMRRESFPAWQTDSLEAINHATQRKASALHGAEDNDIEDVGLWNEDSSGDWAKWGKEISLISGTSGCDDWESAVWYPPGEAGGIYRDARRVRV